MTQLPDTEEAVWHRPDPVSIRAKWDAVFSDPLLSLSGLKAAALSKRGLGKAEADGGVVLRSVFWRAYHNLLPPPSSPQLYPDAVPLARKMYDELRRRWLVAPDGRWAADCTGGENWDNPATTAEGEDGWDPLSLDGQSPWKTWFAHLDLRATIRQDVERTFPDIAYFTLERVRKSLTTILFLFSVLNPDVGYRQGMHELLAACYLVVDRDSLDASQTDSLPSASSREAALRREAMRSTLDRRYIEHDAFQLFQAIMKYAKAFYEWRAEEGPRLRASANVPQAPIITRCNHIHSNLIRRIDPQLWERLEAEGVEAQIWAIRWIRLMFTRELPLSLALKLWDGVFAEDPGLGLLDFICVAMLLLIRNELITADYPGLLTNLLHYPAPSTTYPFSPFLILSQALFLRNNISPASGVEVVIQNSDILGIKVVSAETADEPSHTGSQGRGSMMQGRGGSVRGRGRPGMQGFAQGWLERAQAAGIDKAIMATVADLRKNLPDSATAYSYLPNLPFSPLQSPPTNDRSPISSFPPPASALPPRQPRSTAGMYQTEATSSLSVNSHASERSALDAERQMAELRLAMVGMGKALAEWIDVVRAEGSAEGDVSDLQGQKEQAWKGLERVRDSLLDSGGKDVDEIVKEWGWHEGLETSASRVTTPTPPQPAEAAAKMAEPPVVSAPRASTDEVHRPPPIIVDQGLPPPAVAVLPASPDPQFSAFQQNQAQTPRDSAFSRPPLYLSQRHDRPAAGLPRPVSVTSRPTPTRSPMSPTMSDGVASNTSTPPMTAVPVSSGYREPQSPAAASEPETQDLGDPLAGLGVSVRSPVAKPNRGSLRNSVSGFSGDDPLGAGLR